MDLRCARCGTVRPVEAGTLRPVAAAACPVCAFTALVPELAAREPGLLDSGAPKPGAPKPWVVQTSDGRARAFPDLSTLQRAIFDREVGREDFVLRQNAIPRRLGTFGELAPTFAELDAPHRPLEVTPPYGVPVRALRPPPRSRPEPTSSRTLRPGGELAPDSVDDRSTGRSTDEGVGPPSLPFEGDPAILDPAIPPPPRAPASGFGTLPPRAASESPRLPSSRPAAILARRVRTEPPRGQAKRGRVALRTRRSILPPIGTIPPMRHPALTSASTTGGVLAEATEAPPVEPGGRPRGVFLVLAFALAALAVVVAPRLLDGAAPRPATVGVPTSTPDDERTRGQRAYDAGLAALAAFDLDTADEELVRASALLPDDPGPRRARAEAAILRAEIAWLAVRLVPADAVERRELARLRWRDLAGRARRLVEAAVDDDRDRDPAARILRVDALRIDGAEVAARDAASALERERPAALYAAAVIDATLDPKAESILERLEKSAAEPRVEPRALAALAWIATVRDDRVAADRALARLSQRARPHPLLAELRAFAAGRAKDEIIETLAPLAAGGPKSARSTTPADLLRRADRAAKAGDRSTARALLGRILSDAPNDVEALAALAELDVAAGDHARARQRFIHALEGSPSYLPALLGLADLAWARGERAEARRRYAEIRDSFPIGTYPPRVRARADESP
jgi:tetratricopeptide (TPR) repeat protein